MENKINVLKYFKKALHYSLKKKGYGAQSWAAHKIGVSQQYISKLANIKNMISGSETTRRKIANVFGYEYEDFLALGRRLSEGKDIEVAPIRADKPFPDYDKIMQLPIEDRAWAIYRKAAEAHGLTGYLSALGDRHTKEKPALIAKYLAGEIIETELYLEADKEFGDLAKKFRAEIKKRGL